MKSSICTKVSQEKQQLWEDKEDPGEIKEIFFCEEKTSVPWHGPKVCILSASDSDREETAVQNCLCRNVTFKR